MPLKDVLQMSLKDNDNSFLTSFNILLGIEQGPDDLCSSSVLIISQISFGLVGTIKKEYGILGPRQHLGPPGL